MSVVSEYETVPVAVDDPDEYLAQLERDKELLAGVRTGEWLDQQDGCSRAIAFLQERRFQ